MGHDGWANVITLSNIHERSLFTSRFHLYKNTKVSMETPYIRMQLSPTSKLGYLSFKLLNFQGKLLSRAVVLKKNAEKSNRF